MSSLKTQEEKNNEITIAKQMGWTTIDILKRERESYRRDPLLLVFRGKKKKKKKEEKKKNQSEPEQAFYHFVLLAQLSFLGFISRNVK